MQDAWIEWRERCALGRCSTGTRRALAGFARHRLRIYVQRYAPHTGADAAPEDAWHLLEAYLTVSQTRQGKRYKDWLFARVEHSRDDPLRVIEGGATLILRDVAREYLRREAPRPQDVSLDAALGAERDGRPLTLLDLLPASADPLTDVALREYEALARSHAGVFLTELLPRERIVLAARELGLSLAHPAVERLAGCKKSMLNNSYRAFVVRVAAALKQRYPDEDPQSLLTLVWMTVERVASEVLSRAKSEKAFAALFMLVEEDTRGNPVNRDPQTAAAASG